MTYIAFLRAINVGGRAIVKMDDLKRAFTVAGCEQVKTYIQSGNVVFDVSEKSAATITRKIQTKLRDLLGSEATVVLRTLREVESIVKRNPFKELEADAEITLADTPLPRKPSAPWRHW